MVYHVVLFQIFIVFTFGLILMLKSRYLLLCIDLSEYMVPLIGDIAVHRCYFFYQCFVISWQAKEFRTFFTETELGILAYICTTIRTVPSQVIVTQIEDLLWCTTTLDRCIRLRTDHFDRIFRRSCFSCCSHFSKPFPGSDPAFCSSLYRIVKIDRRDTVLTHQISTHSFDTFIIISDPRCNDQIVIGHIPVFCRRYFIVVRVKYRHFIFYPVHAIRYKVCIVMLYITLFVEPCRHKNLARLVKMYLIGSDKCDLGIGCRFPQSCRHHNTAGTTTDDHDPGFFVTARSGFGRGWRTHHHCCTACQSHNLQCISSAHSL